MPYLRKCTNKITKQKFKSELSTIVPVQTVILPDSNFIPCNEASSDLQQFYLIHFSFICFMTSSMSIALQDTSRKQGIT